MGQKSLDISDFAAALASLDQDLGKTVILNNADAELAAAAIPRLSEREAYIVYLILENGPTHGLALVAHSDGTIPRGTIYTTLNRMESKGYLTSEKIPAAQGEQGPKRVVYDLAVRFKTAFKVQLLLGWLLSQ